MALEKTIQKDIMLAMKTKDENKLMSLRAVKTAITNYKSSPSFNGDKNVELDDSIIIKIMQKLVKERKDSAQVYSSANRNELAEKEINEAYVIESYLPKPLTEDEVTEIVKEAMKIVNATSIKDMGKVISHVNSIAAGRTDGKTISNIVKSMLN